jgi:hypothetical protein
MSDERLDRIRKLSEDGIDTERVLLSCCDALRSQWQPIATAPKDGTLVLLYIRHLFGHHDRSFDAARWNAEKEEWIYDAYPSGEVVEVWGHEWATHWQPLPAPPEE